LVILKRIEIELAILVLLEHFVESLAGEGRLAQSEDVEDDADAEQVAGDGVGSFAVLEVGDLGSHVAGSPAAQEHQFPRCPLGQSEVRNHALAAGLAVEYVFRFQVAVHQALLVHGLQPEKHSAHGCPDLLRAEAVLGPDLIVELTARQQFHADVEGVLGLVYSFHPH
jgi:hypothetical protein